MRFLINFDATKGNLVKMIGAKEQHIGKSSAMLLLAIGYA